LFDISKTTSPDNCYNLYMKISPLQALWLSLAITVFYPIVGKLKTGHISPSVLMLFATGIPVLCYIPYLTKHKMWKILFDKKIALRLAGLGFFSSAFPFLCMMIALNYTTPANSSILNQTEVLYSLLLTYIFLGERPTVKQIFGTIFILTGVIFILMEANKFNFQMKGDLLIICTTWMFQVGHILAKKLPPDLTEHFITAARAFYAFIFTIPLTYVLTFFDMPPYIHYSWQTVVSVLFMGVAFYIYGNYLWYIAIRRMDLSKATTLMLTYPVFTYILSAIFGFDKITVLKTLGIIFALGGAYMVNSIIKTKKEK